MTYPATSVSSGVANISGQGEPSNACALRSNGDIVCWNGINAPNTLSALTGNASAVSVGGGLIGYNYQTYFACAVTKAGAVWCWGNDNSSGQIGIGTTAVATVPDPVSTLSSGVRSVSAGMNNSACAVATDGNVWCWGSNAGGLLGNGTNAPSSLIPVELKGFTDKVASVAVGYTSACALTVGGGVECWGSNESGQLGNGSMMASTEPVPVTGIASGATAVSVGAHYACAVVTGGLQCWGSNGFGASTVPGPVMGLSTDVTDVSVGYDSACAVVGGAVKCWGQNGDGQLGNDSTTPSAAPVLVSNLSSAVVGVSVGYEFGCAVTATGAVWCWDGKPSTPSVPLRIQGFPG